MRVASVLVLDHPEPRLAFVGEEGLYDVEQLEEVFGSPLGLEGPADFHQRVFALRCAGLAGLHKRLVRHPPSQARLSPESYTFLPPCDPERVTVVLVDAFDEGQAPGIELAPSRNLLGHDTRVPMSPYAAEGSERRITVQLGIAVFLHEDLSLAPESEVRAALAGYAVAGLWGPDEPLPAVQLGPGIMPAFSLERPGPLSGRIRVGQRSYNARQLGDARFSVEASIARLSERMPMRAGDAIVFKLPCHAPLPRIAEGDRVEFGIDKLGVLSGTAVRVPKTGAA